MSSSGVVEASHGADQAAVEFGPFRYDPARREIRDAHGLVRLGSRALQILEVLLEQPGRLYSRDELVARVWPHTVVEETSLRVHISALRKALGDGQDGARYVTNVPGRGYAFVGEVRAAPPAAASTQAEVPPAPAGAAAALPPRSIRPIGREQVIAQIGELLARDQLVSLVGAGGMGKTTVALAVAESLAPSYPHGVFFVDLSRVADPSRVAAELGLTQGLIEPPGSPTAGLELALRSRHLLFVIDNCEHLIDAVADLVARLMQTCPAVHFLATSREPLEVPQEKVVKLQPLALPGPHEAPDARELLAYPAIQLFVERAAAICGGFELSEANAPAVQQLCGFLDGIPLAIELAAARVDSLGVAGLLQHLERAFEVLTRGRRTALSRHRTLQAVMDWSYDLLGDGERLVLQRLSVFRAGFTLDSAVTVACSGSLTRDGVIEGVLSLCAKSLVVLDLQGHDVPQYRLLYVTRLYAQRRLDAGDDGPEVHRRHALFVLNGLLRTKHERLAQGHLPPDTGSTFADANAAVEWALIEENDLALGAELTSTALRTYVGAGRVAEYRQLIRTALEKMPRVAADQERLELSLRVVAASTMGFSLDGAHGRQALFTRTRQLMEGATSTHDRLDALHGMCIGAYGLGDYRQVLGLCDEIRELAVGEHVALEVAVADRLSALCLHALGEHDAAEVLAWRVIAHRGPPLGRTFVTPVPYGVSMRILLARVLWLRAEFGKAWQMLQEVLEASVDIDAFGRCQVLGLAAIPLAIWRGEPALARGWTQELWKLWEARHLPYWEAHAKIFNRVLDGEPIAVNGADDPLVMRCPPLGDMAATLCAECPAASTRARVKQGAVGWCAPEVMRLAAIDEVQRAPGEAQALLAQALRLAHVQGARFWVLRLALTQAKDARFAGISSGRAALREWLPRIDDGSDVPELTAARALLRGEG